MSDVEIMCFDCQKPIMTTKTNDDSFLSHYEKIDSEINYIITELESQETKEHIKDNYIIENKIKKSVCVDCADKFQKIRKKKIENFLTIQNQVAEALKNLLVDINYNKNKEFNENPSLNNEITMLYQSHQKLISEKKETQNKIDELLSEIEKLNQEEDTLMNEINIIQYHNYMNNEKEKVQSEKITTFSNKINSLNENPLYKIQNLYCIIINNDTFSINNCCFTLDNLDTFNYGLTNIVELTVLLSTILTFNKDNKLYTLLPNGTRSQILKRMNREIHVLYLLSKHPANIKAFITGIEAYLTYLKDFTVHINSNILTSPITFTFNKTETFTKENIPLIIKKILSILSSILYHPQLEKILK